MSHKQVDAVVGVYMLHNQETGEAYIGSGVLNLRRNAHFSRLRNNTHHNSKLQSAFNQNPNFEFIGVPVDGETREEARAEALQIEAALVVEHANDPKLLNLMRDISEENTCLGHGDETKEKIREKTKALWEKDPGMRIKHSEQKQALWQDPQWREKVVAAQRAGKAAMTEEERLRAAQNVSEGLKQAYAVGVRVSNKGQTRGEEFKQQTSERIANKWQDPEYRANQMASRPKGKRNDNGLSVAVEVDGVVYPTKTAAAQAHGITKQGVSHRLTSDRFPNWQTVS